MRTVVAEGTKYSYFGKSDGLPKASQLDAPLMGLDTQLAHYIATNNDIRIVVVKLERAPKAALVCCLHWDNNLDLDLLDERVEHGTHTDEDFRYAMKANFGPVQCLRCHDKWPALKIDRGDPYLGAPGLLEEKLRTRTERGGLKSCPNCGERFRIPVVEVFDDREEQKSG